MADEIRCRDNPPDALRLAGGTGKYASAKGSMKLHPRDAKERRSIPRYRAVLESAGAPDPFRSKYREHLGEAVRNVVATGSRLAEAVAVLALPAEDQAPFQDLSRVELLQLQPYNCARYRLSIGKTEEWIAKGRPM
jgi:hypothetical protein